MRLFFTKMQGCGNDYIYFDCFHQNMPNPEELGKRFADRHFGIGGDGIVLICPSEIADAKMRMFNACAAMRFVASENICMRIN